MWQTKWVWLGYDSLHGSEAQYNSETKPTSPLCFRATKFSMANSPLELSVFYHGLSQSKDIESPAHGGSADWNAITGLPTTSGVVTTSRL